MNNTIYFLFICYYSFKGILTNTNNHNFYYDCSTDAPLGSFGIQSIK